MNVSQASTHVGTAAPGCPVERSSTAFDPFLISRLSTRCNAVRQAITPFQVTLGMQLITDVEYFAGYYGLYS